MLRRESLTMLKAPEKKILKEMLVKLKTKVINSQKMFFGFSLTMSTSMNETLKESLESLKKMPEGKDKTQFLLMLNVLNNINQNLNLLITSISSLIGDMNLYIETLERYSTELDNTLTDIFEEARKIAEEQRKQQALKKKEPSYRA